MIITVSSDDHDPEGHEQLSLGNAAYAWLAPYLKAVEEQTGKLIHPYEVVALKGQDLDFLEAEINRAVMNLESSPPKFSIVYLQRTTPDGKTEDIAHTFEKLQVRAILETLMRLVKDAKDTNRFLLCRGS